MGELLQAQTNGNMVGDSSRLRQADIQIIPYSMDSLKGHAAWLDWPWKLHRIQNREGETKWEFYNLENDPMEVQDLVGTVPKRITEMKMSMEEWQVSVLKSLNGLDY
jgi:hypothetical protein